LLALLMLPLLSRIAMQPGMPERRDVRLDSFALDADPTPARAADLSSAIVLPLDEQSGAFRLTAPEDGVAFDIDGDGTTDRVAWTEAGAEVAFLALDTDGDGRITSGRELFGSHMVPGVTNGCNALLRAFEASGAPRSASVHAGHELYRRLLLWVDRNHDGRSQRDELRPASDTVTAIGLGFTKMRGWDAHGNRVRWDGWLEREQRIRPYYEVVLSVR
jgi:hypothetical protein